MSLEEGIVIFPINIRNNGPFEYDKWIITIGQLYNMAEDEKEKYAQHKIHAQLDMLDTLIQNLLESDSWINRIVLLSRKRSKTE